MKENYHFEMKLSEDLLRKLIYVAEAEGRSANNTMLLMLRNYVAYFERAKGKIDRNRLAGIDLSPYRSEE